MLHLSDFENGITQPRVHSFQDGGASVFFRDSIGKHCVGMINGHPTIETIVRVEDLMEWVEALEIAMQSLESDMARVKPVDQSRTALQKLHCLQLDMERLIKRSFVMHNAIVNCLAEEAPQMMKSYLSAFSSAVGKGEV